jgi:hypothetical protein
MRDGGGPRLAAGAVRAKTEAVRSNVLLRLAALALATLVLGGCSAPASRPPGAQPRRGPAVRRPGNPLLLSCDQTSSAGPQQPGPGDLVVGPLWIIDGRDSVGPDGTGPHPQHGYKYPIAVTPGATVTMTIAPQARGHVVIDNPYGPPDVVAATYRACQPGSSSSWSVFVQGFTFTDGRVRGCVPLTVQAGPGARIRHVTASLYAGPCTA